MGVNSAKEVLEMIAEKGAEKARYSMLRMLLLGVMGGAYVALGYLAYIRISAGIPQAWGGLGGLLGACVFPIGLMAILIGGGELVTGNMMVLAISFFLKKIQMGKLLRNWFFVTLANLVGGMLVALLFGHFVGMTEGDYLAKTLAAAGGKVKDSAAVALISGIGANVFVGLAVWFYFSAKSFNGKIVAIWFPVMAFVVIGFQHVVANMFIIPAAIFSGAATISWFDFAANLIPVWIGNMVGGAVVIGGLHTFAYRSKPEPAGVFAQEAEYPVASADL